jgi:DNA-binding PadR family transcriptional regulator
MRLRSIQHPLHHRKNDTSQQEQNMSENPRKPAPLSEQAFLILLSLAPGPKHGYAILKDVEQLSDGKVVLGTGTLYGGLKRLMAQELIERAPDPIPNETARERNAYALTEAGRKLMNAEASRLDALLRAARLRLQPGRTEGG